MNPLYQANSGPNKATAPSNDLNTATPSVRHSFNRFNNGFTHYTTASYGEYTPFFSQICNPADSKKFRSVSQVRTLTLKSPLYSRLKMNKDYFFVPMDVIMPNNWQKIYRNPSQGDDVPDDANTYIPDVNLIFEFARKFFACFTSVSSSADTTATKRNALRFIYASFPLMDAFFSASGLCSRLGYNLVHNLSITSPSFWATWDRFADEIFPILFDAPNSFPFQIPSSAGYIFQISNTQDLMNNQYPNNIQLGPKDAMSLFRYFYDYIDNGKDTISDLYANFLDRVAERFVSTYENATFTLKKHISSNFIDTQNLVFNFDQCVAYNLVCSQFYTNGNVDSVYNAELYRDMLGSQIHSFNGGFDTFAYNGVNTLYDVTSGHYVLKAFGHITNFTMATVYPIQAVNYLKNIFCIHNSLKYGDYFVGAHTRPLAVGDVTAPVIGNSVSAVDVTKAIAYQRFLNVVVKLKNSFADYLRSLFGTLPAPDYHEAKFISHSEGSIDGFEVANTTSQNQGELVSLLHNVNENFEFELQCDMPGIALGIVSFVSSRAYCQTKDRMFMRRDRYDMFNPMLQTIGDQPILAAEKNIINSVPYGYVARYMEYKQRYNIASGAFDDALKSYCIICDSLTSTANALELISPTLNPASIRLTPRELDRYFQNQSYWSYGNSFHFICEFDNQVDDIREADYAPSIL